VVIEGRGHVLNGSVVAISYVNEVIGTSGAINTAIIAGSQLDAYQAYKGTFGGTGWVGTVDFSGQGAAIDGAEVYAQYMLQVSTSADSDGISNSFFTGSFPPINQDAIGSILAGGPGLYNCTIAGNGGAVGTIRGVGGVADIWENEIDPTTSARSPPGTSTTTSLKPPATSARCPRRATSSATPR
jgi:hypothetical protein